MAATALHNVGIDDSKMIRAGQAQALTAAQVVQQGAALVEANEDELVYETTFDIPDKGQCQLPLGEAGNDTFTPVIALSDVETHNDIQVVRRYPTRARRSAVGNQPYDTYASRPTVLQLGAV